MKSAWEEAPQLMSPWCKYWTSWSSWRLELARAQSTEKIMLAKNGDLKRILGAVHWVGAVGSPKWANPLIVEPLQLQRKHAPDIKDQQAPYSLFSAECLIKKISLLVPTNNNNIDSFGTNISLFSWAVGRWVGGNSLEGGSSCGFLS